MSQTIDNPTVTVASAAELTALVEDCRDPRRAIVDYGVAHEGLGHAPPASHVRLARRGGIREHHERDLTVQVAAGMALGALQAALAPAGQFLPVDADGDVTVGELIDHHVYGPLRLTYGSIRDLLLGLRYVDGHGRDVHAGGRTVKNVAGYDMSRFLVGGLGEFGLVHEATLRTYAVPPMVLNVVFGLDDPSWVDDRLPGWLLSDAAPGALSLDALEGGGWQARVAWFGTERGCTTQWRSLSGLLSEASVEAAEPQRGDLAAYLDAGAEARAWRRAAAALVMAVVPPASTGALCRDLRSRGDGPLRISAQPAHGCVFVGGDLSAVGAAALDEHITALIAPLGGLRVWHRRPPDAVSIAPFAPPQPDEALLQRLKHAADPLRLLNPGRLLAVSESTS